MNPTEMMQKVAQVAPEKHAFFKQAAAEISRGPFVEEVRSELDGIMKKAQGAWSQIGSAAKSTGSFLGGIGAAAGTAALGGIAMALAGDLYGAEKRGLTKSRNYRAMLEANPDLREAPKERVQQAFSTLHRLNPEFSGDPTVAGSYVRGQAQFDLHQWNPQEMKTLIDSHKSLQDIDRLPQVPNFNPYSMQTQRADLAKKRQDADPEFQRAMREPHGSQILGNELKNMQMIHSMQRDGIDEQKALELRRKMRAMGG